MMALAMNPTASATTLLHYQVNESDAATVAGGIVPGVDGSADGTVNAGSITLSSDLPGMIPVGGGDRSPAFDGSSGIILPGTQQLLNSVVEASGGLTMEAWFSFAGGGTVNSIIDYAGTEKLFRASADAGAGYRNNSAAPLYLLGNTTGTEWHYSAVVFTPTSTVGGSGEITGYFTFYFDSLTPVFTETGVTISEFGDSLNRTIGVGTHLRTPCHLGGTLFVGIALGLGDTRARLDRTFADGPARFRLPATSLNLKSRVHVPIHSSFISLGHRLGPI